jgi:predicted permease
MQTLLQDLRYGLRMLAKNPGFTLVAVVTLALGIGANTAIFSVVNAVVLRPLPYPESKRLLWISDYVPVLKAHITSGADYVDWKEQNKTLESITAYDDSASFNLTGHGTPARVQGARVSATLFATLGVQPDLGRSFNAREDQPNGPHVAILMHSFWQQYFGSDPAVLGRTITLDAAPCTVVGVMPADFKFPGNSETQFLVPLQLNEAQERLRFRMAVVHVIGRMKPDVTVARIKNDLEVIQKRAESAALARGPLGRGPMGAPGAGPAGGGPSGPGPGMMMRFQGPNGPPTSSGTGTQLPGGESRRGEFATSPLQRGNAASGRPQRQVREGRPANAPPPAGGAMSRQSQQEMPGGGIQNPPARAGAAPQGSQPRMAPAPGSGGQGPGRVMRPPDMEIEVVPLAEHLAGNLRPAMLTMLGVVGLVLLIACANVANLMLARASGRTREVAVRAALGASRGRLVRQLLTESVLMAFAGGAAGLLLAAWGVNVMTRLIPSSLGGAILSVKHPHLDATVLLFALAVSVLTGILFGLAPALAATRPDLVEHLKDSAQVPTAGGGGAWLRGALAVAELSLALVVLIGAGLLIKSFYRLLSVDLGFAPEHVLTMNINLTDSRYPQAEQKVEFFSQVLRKVETLPGVRSTALSDSLPLSPFRARLMITPPWLLPPTGSPPGSNMVQMNRLAVSPSYFYTLGIPLLKGRTFTDRDDEQAEHVAVVNEALGRRLWPGENPVGRDLPLFDNKLKIVGVVGNTHHDGPGADVVSEIYVPYLQAPGGDMQLAVRSATDPASLADAVRLDIAAVDPEQPIDHLATLEQTLSQSFAPRRFNTLLLGIFALIALVLASVGIYGVIAYSVTQRTHEIGIRMALGAERRDILRLVVGQGLRLTLIGVAIGIIGALALTRFLASLLYGVQPTDALTFIAVSSVMAGVALLACYIPARRATKVDPMAALRYE